VKAHRVLGLDKVQQELRLALLIASHGELSVGPCGVTSVLRRGAEEPAIQYHVSRERR
jgi:hypothetical protein